MQSVLGQVDGGEDAAVWALLVCVLLLCQCWVRMPTRIFEMSRTLDLDQMKQQNSCRLNFQNCALTMQMINLLDRMK